MTVFADALCTMPTTEAAVLNPSHRGLRNNEVDHTVIDTDRTRLNPFREFPSLNLIPSKNAAIETVTGIIGQMHRLLGIFHLHNRDDRAKGLFPYDLHFVINIHHHRRLVVKSLRVSNSTASSKNFGAFLNSLFDLRLYFFKLSFRGHASQLHFIITRSLTESSDSFDDLVDKILVDRLLNINAFNGSTDLS